LLQSRLRSRSCHWDRSHPIPRKPEERRAHHRSTTMLPMLRPWNKFGIISGCRQPISGLRNFLLLRRKPPCQSVEKITTHFPMTFSVAPVASSPIAQSIHPPPNALRRRRSRAFLRNNFDCSSSSRIGFFALRGDRALVLGNGLWGVDAEPREPAAALPDW
jgi:hypothetical protein